MKMPYTQDSNWFKFILQRENYYFPGMMVSMVTMGVITASLVYIHQTYNVLNITLPSSFQTVLGLVVGLLLVFRTNTAYDRWWEGRKQLGALVNTTRDMAIKYNTFVDSEQYDKIGLMQDMISAYVYALKMHLREQDYSEAEKYIPEELRERFLASVHKPNFLLTELGKHSIILLRKDIITGYQLRILDEQLTALINIQGACERIRNTPIPMGYGLHLKRILFVYISITPIGFINELNYLAVPIVMIIFYVMVGIELIGEEIEDPFGTDPNDLPFDELHEKIAENVNEIAHM